VKFASAILSFLLLASAISTRAQPLKDRDSVFVLLRKIKQTRLDKSIVLLTNRDLYLAGEKIWFKAYAINSDDGRLDLTFNNLFVDLVNERDSVVDRLVLDNRSLNTDGAFSLPLSIPSGFYFIRGYAAAQLNNSNGICVHPVFILNKQRHDQTSYLQRFEKNFGNSNEITPVIHFYTERLSANPGIISTGVIEIRDAYNTPLSVKGNLVNSKDSIVTTFTTNSLGLARLTFVNDSAEKYSAVFAVNGDMVTYGLPQANKSAIQLSVGNQTTKTIKAFVTLEDSVPTGAHTTILAVHRDSLYYAAVGTGNYGITIPLDNFPGGITNLLLFDGTKNLIDERKIYIPKDNLALEIKPDKKKYSARESVNVHVRLSAVSREPVASLLNVSVEEESIQQLSDSLEENVLPPGGDFLLEDWLNRHHSRYSPNDIDLLLATRKSIPQGPRVLLDKEIQDYDDNQKLQNLKGKIVNTKGNGVGDRIVTAIAINTSQFFMDVDTTVKDGRFNLVLPQGFDSLQLSLQVTDKHQLQTPTDSVRIEGFQFPSLSTPPTVKQQLFADNIKSISSFQKLNVDTTFFPGKGWLPLVTVKAIKKKELNYDESRRITSISQILTSDKFRYGGRNAIGNAILTVPGVTLISGDISIFGLDISAKSQIRRPLIIMDGYEIPLNVAGSVLDFLNSLSPADIDFIEVLRGAEAAVYGHRGAYGVISINSRHGPDKGEYEKSNLRIFTPITYHVCPKFEMPEYSNQGIKNSPYPDPRTTIYWKGNITTDPNGEADISFYTGDNFTNYAITITGLTETGEPIYKRVIINNSGKSR
jgi:hypothetical protein